MITALILAAGESKRMGQPKMLLPWEKTTVLGHVIEVFQRAEIEDILVITGGARKEVEEIATANKARIIFNPRYASGEMLSSVQAGLRTAAPQTSAALIALGDQPQVEEANVRLVVKEYERSHADLIVPSYQLRRGHPWLVAQKLWSKILVMRSPESLRDFLKRHAQDIHYVNVDSPSILADLDTPEDYLKSRPLHQ